jgi:hypothetical protein
MGAEKLRCTVMLAITANGLKLTPYVLFKCETMAKKLPQEITVQVE